ncbi:MAG: DNA mismatch repair endonuclease MutL [Myxococcales bacterium]|nr:DNA mismatch repair endonuclease MutL [Myxococcales bacterium]
MNRRIHVLPDHVANQIAAGEVVERPESVVKELVENALDAGATRIRIELEDGGQRLIRILDDGGGMSPDDAMTALLRHATSKVRSADDLKTIETLGFRGEALPSIRSISRFSMRTRERGADEGVRIVGHGADEPVMAPAGGPVGTEITVEELFFNVPARRKFLKQSSTELQRIRSFVERIALGWPEVHFTLVHGGKTSLDFPADGNLQDRIISVLGRESCKRLWQVELTVGDHRVTGFAGDPGFVKANPNWIYSFINGRFVRDKVIQHAITQAYSQLLERQQFPVAVLFLFVPPGSVDINVHPTKSEVRFVESGAIHGLVLRALRLMLNDAPWGLTATPNLPMVGRSSPLGGEGTSLSFLPLLLGEEAPPTVPTSPIAPAWTREPSPEAPPRLDSEPESAPGERVEARVPTKPVWRCVGVVLGRWIVAENPEGLVLIDGPAASVRVMEQRLLRGAALSPAPAQQLLFPEPVTLTPREAGLAASPVLAELGFAVEPFGGGDVLVSAVPAPLPALEPARFIRAAVGAMVAGRSHLSEVARAVAEQAAPMPGEPLGERELVAELSSLDPALLHTRPTVITSFSPYALERLFPR